MRLTGTRRRTGTGDFALHCTLALLLAACEAEPSPAFPTQATATTAAAPSAAVVEDEPFVYVTASHWRLGYEITRGRVTPSRTLRFEGDYRGTTAPGGALLIVASAFGVPRWVQLVLDPRTRS